MAQIEKIPPHSEEAERSVLGSILLDKDVFFKVAEFVTADDFYSKAHKEIFTAMNELFKDNSPIDVITVTEALQRRKSLDAVGGRGYIADLSAEIVTTANAVSYAKIIADKSVHRKLITAGSKIVESAFNEAKETDKALDEAESSIFEISKNKQTRDYIKIQNVLEKNLSLIETAEKNKGQLPGISTGFKDLDRMTTGLQNSDLIILAARPSMGKTAFALNIARNVALNGKRVVFFSAEMSDVSLGYRLLSIEARIKSDKLKRGELDSEDWESLHNAIDNFKDADLIIDETPSIGVMEVRNKCRRINAEKKIDLVIIDYLQIMQSDGKNENRVLEIATMTRYLKQLARELECPVIVLSQLSRSTVQREGDKRPMLSDLRDSGAIEQDADVVMFLHREDYFKRDREPDNICEVIIAKQRQGETGTVKLTWIPVYTKFADMYNGNDAGSPAAGEAI